MQCTHIAVHATLYYRLSSMLCDQEFCLDKQSSLAGPLSKVEWRMLCVLNSVRLGFMVGCNMPAAVLTGSVWFRSVHVCDAIKACTGKM